MAARGFIELLRLAERGKQRQQQIDTHLQWSGVAFLMMGQYFVAPLGDVAEVIYLPERTTVPFAQPWVLGISNLRGRLMSVIDLTGFFAEQVAEIKSTSKVLYLAHPEHSVGVVVDQVFGIQHFDTRAYFSGIAPDMTLPPKMNEYCQGYFMHKNKTWQVVMLRELFANSQFMNPARERS